MFCLRFGQGSLAEPYNCIRDTRILSKNTYVCAINRQCCKPDGNYDHTAAMQRRKMAPTAGTGGGGQRASRSHFAGRSRQIRVETIRLLHSAAPDTPSRPVKLRFRIFSLSINAHGTVATIAVSRDPCNCKRADQATDVTLIRPDTSSDAFLETEPRELPLAAAR
ncbi:unnamed protein product [Lasius platythorax]|uniref:Uncharacterized protein n=1 Tax=Lasius platythorax TaxID=488582 RepID=A0AAV2P9E5_9HYME